MDYLILYNRKIDIIMPAYNVPEATLRRALASIASQNTIQDIEITIVDDASTNENYENIVAPFRAFCPIKILKNQINAGPGVARQIGLNNTNNEYIIFMDADDTFYDCFSIQHLRDGIEEEGNDPNDVYQAAAGVFLECINEYNNKLIHGYMNVEVHKKNFVHVFAKIYRRSFIEKYEIKFHPTSRANEDAGFTTAIRLIANEHEKINFIEEVVYCWRENLSSITRRNKGSYSYGTSSQENFGGYIENMIYAQRLAKEKAPNNIEQFNQWCVRVLIFSYQHYIENYRKHKKETEENLYWVKLYYDEIYSKVENLITPECLTAYFSNTIKTAYAREDLNNVIPHITFYDFLNKVKKLPKKRH